MLSLSSLWPLTFLVAVLLPALLLPPFRAFLFLLISRLTSLSHSHNRRTPSPRYKARKMGSETSDQGGLEGSNLVPGSKEAISKADEAKKQANDAFQEHHFSKAVDLYTEALQLNPLSAILWANRSFAHTKLEEYGSAIEDATKAIELDPKYVKGYYRRGTAHLAMAKFKPALLDFKQAVTIAPKDPDARKKMKECEKAVREQAFYDAISHPETGGGEDVSIDVSSMEVEDTYTGARLDERGVTSDFIQKMMEDFKDQKKLHRKYAYEILMKVRDILKAQPTLVDVRIQDGDHITVCGDVHGQFYDLMNIFEMNGLPSEENRYLFNGDFVDRGSFSAEVIVTLFAYKCLYPNSFFLARGNHESRSMNKIYGFDGEIETKFGEKMVELFAQVFCCLPLAHVLNSKIFIVHGGLFSKDGVTLDDIRSIDRFKEPPEEGLMCEILWSDPGVVKGRVPSKRGVGVAFGPDVTERFLSDNNLELVVRSHEVKDEGYEVEHGGKLITVFSAPNYCDQMGNKVHRCGERMHGIYTV